MRFPALVGAALLVAGNAPVEGGAPIGRLSWLSGCWESVRGERRIEEQWMAPRGGSMLGLGRTVVRDSTVEFEYVRIHERDGRLVYTAKPSGQAEASFSSVTLSDSLVVFEDPAHDFPQRIIYRRQGADSLVARIEGERNGKLRGVDFPMRRAACGGTAGR